MQRFEMNMVNFHCISFLETSEKKPVTVEPRYNEDLGTMKIVLLQQVFVLTG